MTPKITDEMRTALSQCPGGPIEVRDDESNTVYLLVARDAIGELVDETLRQALQIGLDQSDRGESEPWDVDAFLEKAHRRHAQRSA